jgi:hypothetical protein
MKIILSPSKTQSNIEYQEGLKHPLFYTFSKQIIKEIKSYNKNDLSKIMHINDKLLEETYIDYKNYKVNQKELIPSIKLYKGVVYECFKLEEMTIDELDYLNKHIRIISALYGVLEPFDGTLPYRLDFTMRLNQINLNQFWKNKLVTYFKKEDFILDCASHEFSHFLNPLKEKVHRIEFIDQVDGQDKIISYNAKKMRGLMAYYCVKHNVQTIDAIKQFDLNGYQYDASSSNNNYSVFKRYSETESNSLK